MQRGGVVVPQVQATWNASSTSTAGEDAFVLHHRFPDCIAWGQATAQGVGHVRAQPMPGSKKRKKYLKRKLGRAQLQEKAGLHLVKTQSSKRQDKGEAATRDEGKKNDLAAISLSIPSVPVPKSSEFLLYEPSIVGYLRQYIWVRNNYVLRDCHQPVKGPIFGSPHFAILIYL